MKTISKYAVFLTATAFLGSSFAHGQTLRAFDHTIQAQQNLSNEKKSIAFSHALSSEINTLKSMSEHLDQGDTKLIMAARAVQIIFVIEAVYWGTRTVAVSKSAAGADTATKAFDGIIKIFAVPIGFLTSLGFTSSMMDYLIASPKQIKIWAHAQMDEPMTGLKKSANQVAAFSDLGLRSDHDALQDFTQKPDNYKKHYLQSIEDKLTLLQSMYQFSRKKLDEKYDQLLEKHDPAQMNYILRIMSIGSDQLNYGALVSTKMQAQIDLASAFLSLNNNLLNESSLVKQTLNH